jgi:hypothetical protein
MAAGGHLDFDNNHDVSRINGISTLNKMTPAWRRSAKRFRSYRIYCVIDCISHLVMYIKLRSLVNKLLD